MRRGTDVSNAPEEPNTSRKRRKERRKDRLKEKRKEELKKPTRLREHRPEEIQCHPSSLKTKRRTPPRTHDQNTQGSEPLQRMKKRTLVKETQGPVTTRAKPLKKNSKLLSA
jgi:hypothetical protein